MRKEQAYDSNLTIDILISTAKVIKKIKLYLHFIIFFIKYLKISCIFKRICLILKAESNIYIYIKCRLLCKQLPICLTESTGYFVGDLYQLYNYQQNEESITFTWSAGCHIFDWSG